MASALLLVPLGALTPGCAAPVPRPAGVPETPYWFAIGDSIFWYAPADSLALVQFAEGTGAPEVEEGLYLLRDLGWRMTPERGPALQRAGQEQSLAQRLFQVERVARAGSPVDRWGTFERRFRSRRGEPSGPLMGILPGLRSHGQPPTKYYWPNCLSITWGDSLTASEAESWLHEQGCRVLTAPQLTHQYYVQRVWVVETPAGTPLFDWLRRLNGDTRIETAYPISSLREPPAPDPRDAGRNQLAGSTHQVSPGRPLNCSEVLWQAYRIARFAGFTAHVTRATPVQVEGDLLKVLLITRKDKASADSALVEGYGGRVISQSGARVEAWVPYTALPALALESCVLKLDVAGP